MCSCLLGATVALLKPMIGATEALSKATLGLHNTVNPLSKRQADDKFKAKR